MKGVDPQGEDDENNDDILDGELVLRHPRVVPILRNIVTLTLFIQGASGIDAPFLIQI
jgi:hypothetical protein